MQIEDLIIRREFRSTSYLFGVAIRTDFWDSYAISRQSEIFNFVMMQNPKWTS